MSSLRLSVRIFLPLLNSLQFQSDQQGLTLTEGVLATYRVADLYEMAPCVGDTEERLLVKRIRQVEKSLAVLEGKQ